MGLKYTYYGNQTAGLFSIFNKDRWGCIEMEHLKHDYFLPEFLTTFYTFQIIAQANYILQPFLHQISPKSIIEVVKYHLPIIILI
ncbi:MAG TPA: hypothetical protein PK111_05210 [Atribacterota bacterium]|nr:hypothetical protein [Atribacterota bacterium]